MALFKNHIESFSVRLELNGEILYEGISSELPFPLQIGRSDECFWKVPAEERSVSVLHAEICIRKKMLVIRDLGSRNGLYVMGKRVAEQRLAPGVQVGIGGCRLIVERNQNARVARIRPFHRLERLNGGTGGAFYELREESTVIGSGVVEGIPCADILVSRRHAEIIRKGDDTCWIKDLGSRNGTLVNGTPLKDSERMLRDGDLVTIADIEFRFWDRTVEHVHGRFLVKICIALVTAAVCGSLYLAYQTFLPSAKSILRRVQACEIAGDFKGAEVALEEALRARGAEHYASEIARKKKDLSRWQVALSIWKEAQEAMNTRSWITASKQLGPVLNSAVEYWGWNSTDAPKEKLRARTAKEAMDVFLHARTAFSGSFNDSEAGDIKKALVFHIANMERMLKNSLWTEDVPTGKLRLDMDDQCRRMRLLVGWFEEIDAVMTSFSIPDRNRVTIPMVMKTFDAIRPAIAKMQKICQEQTDAVKGAQILAQKEGRKFVASPLVEQHAQRYLPILEKFLETREYLLGQLTAVVRGENPASGVPSLPTEGQCAVHPLFAALKYSVMRMLEMLSSEVAPNVQDQLGRFGNWKLTDGFSHEALQILTDEGRMNEVFAIRALSGARPSGSRSDPADEYDRLLGFELFAEFLRNVDVERRYPASRDLGVSESLMESVCRLFAQIDRFKAFLQREDIQFLQSLDVADNRIAETGRLVMAIDSKRQLLFDAYWNSEASDLRRRIISRGIALALDAGRTLGEDAALEIRADMRKLSDEIKRLKSKIDSDPDNVDEYRRRILAVGIPGLNGFNAYWDQVMRRKGGGR
ncbi:MAG: FHA domain-containing protein [Kiritimatiellae bacterium]|nr:FHA domain-containing protein [Kiritimatiellia bacterium]